MSQQFCSPRASITSHSISVIAEGDRLMAVLKQACYHVLPKIDKRLLAGLPDASLRVSDFRKFASPWNVLPWKTIAEDPSTPL